MSSSLSDIGLRDYLMVLRRRWFVVALCVGLGLLASVVYSSLQTPLYRSESRVLVQQKSSAALFDPQTGAPLKSDVSTDIELQLLTSQRVRDEAVQRLGYPARIRATTAGEDTVIVVSASDPDPVRAAEIADTFAQTYLDVRRDLAVTDFLATGDVIREQITGLDAQLDLLRAEMARTDDPVALSTLQTREAALEAQRAQYDQSLNAILLNADLAGGSGPQIIAEANEARNPYRPTRIRNAMMGIALGLLAGLGLAFLWDYLDDSVRNRQDIEASGGLPTLAVVPRVSGWRNRSETHVTTLEHPSSSSAEAYRSLRTSVQFAGIERELKVLQLTSPNPGDGKTTTAVNLGVAMAQTGLRVILVDCDLRRPRLHSFLGADPERGITSTLLEDVELVDALQSTDQRNLVLLPAGPVPPAPSELLSAQRTAQTLRALAQACDIVLIDSPPVLPVSDALILSDLVDGVIVVATAGKTGRRDLNHAVEALRQVDAPLIGAVLNQADAGAQYGYSSHYGTYGYTARTPKRSRPWRRSTAPGAEARTRPAHDDDRGDDDPDDGSSGDGVEAGSGARTT